MQISTPLPSKIFADCKNDQALLTPKNKNTMQTFSPSPHTRKRQLITVHHHPSRQRKLTVNDFLSSH